MLRDTPARVLHGWRRFYEYEPWGPDRFDIGIGLLRHTMISLAPNVKANRVPSLEKLVPKFGSAEAAAPAQRGAVSESALAFGMEMFRAAHAPGVQAVN